MTVFSETWLTDDSLDRLLFNEYQIFHLIKKDLKKISGEVSTGVKNYTCNQTKY